MARIPIYECADCGSQFSASGHSRDCPECGSTVCERIGYDDDDSLDDDFTEDRSGMWDNIDESDFDEDFEDEDEDFEDEDFEDEDE